jgi:hypothetical protein
MIEVYRKFNIRRSYALRLSGGDLVLKHSSLGSRVPLRLGLTLHSCERVSELLPGLIQAALHLRIRAALSSASDIICAFGCNNLKSRSKV